MATCHVCAERPADSELVDHARLMHPDDAGEVWPDGALVIHDVTLGPEDF